MKISMLIKSVSRAGGGVFEAARQLSRVLAHDQTLKIEVVSMEDASTAADITSWHPLRPRIVGIGGPRSYGYAPNFRKALDASGADLAHVHGIWTYPSLAASRWSRRHQRPYLVSVHGMLSPYALRLRRWKKLLAASLFERDVLRRAACLHACTTRELESFRKFGLRNPVCVIPNGIDLPFGPAALRPHPPWIDSVEPGGKVLLYLGRLHPSKGLPTLLNAWARARIQRGKESKQWDLVIAGWGEERYEQELRAHARAAGVAQSVHFIGPQFGEQKEAAFQSADGFVLPSLSEGLPMAVLEAWGYSLPVLMTPECNLPEGFLTNSALKIETAEMAKGLEEFVAMSDLERADMGTRGRELVVKQFTWPRIAAQVREVYQWIVGGGQQPGCVFN
jgi:glycosyltransferase involved in cell wall biosynthesis